MNPARDDTIFAVSSGAPPAAIAVMRVSGPAALAAVTAMTGSLPTARRAGLRTLRAANGDVLDRALVLLFPGPATATGEDLVELHLHGGRAVVRAVEAELSAQPGLRPAQPGEFTRRALANGRIDLAQAEGIGDLLLAETERARRAALAASGGAVSRVVAEWIARLIALSARAEAMIDFADEDDVAESPAAVAALQADIAMVADALRAAAARPPVERLRDGIQIVFAGPPNSGKSSLVNALAERDVAIATPIAGTTRDVIETAVVRDGIGYRLTDVAGLREPGPDAVENIGIARAHAAIAGADIVVWLGDDPPPDTGMLAIHARADLPGRDAGDRLAISASHRTGLSELWAMIADRAQEVLPREDEIAFNRRQLARLGEAAQAVAKSETDLILIAEQLRVARAALSGITGVSDVERMLDDLFANFCIGK